MTNSKSAIVYVRLTQGQRTHLDELVRQSSIGTVSDHIRKAVDEYLVRHGASNDAQPSETN